MQLGNTKVSQVQEFKYLGLIFTQIRSLGRDIETRRQKAIAVTYHRSTLLLHANIKMEV